MRWTWEWNEIFKMEATVESVDTFCVHLFLFVKLASGSDFSLAWMRLWWGWMDWKTQLKNYMNEKSIQKEKKNLHCRLQFFLKLEKVHFLYAALKNQIEHVFSLSVSLLKTLDF